MKRKKTHGDDNDNSYGCNFFLLLLLRIVFRVDELRHRNKMSETNHTKKGGGAGHHSKKNNRRVTRVNVETKQNKNRIKKGYRSQCDPKDGESYETMGGRLGPSNPIKVKPSTADSTAFFYLPFSSCNSWLCPHLFRFFCFVFVRDEQRTALPGQLPFLKKKFCLPCGRCPPGLREYIIYTNIYNPCADIVGACPYFFGNNDIQLRALFIQLNPSAQQEKRRQITTLFKLLDEHQTRQKVCGRDNFSKHFFLRDSPNSNLKKTWSFFPPRPGCSEFPGVLWCRCAGRSGGGGLHLVFTQLRT